MVAKAKFFTKHDRGLTIYVDGKSAAVSDTHPQYAQIIDALKRKDFDSARKMMTVKDVIVSAASAAGKPRISVENGNVVYLDANKRKQVLEGPLVDRIITTVERGATEKAIKPLMLFMDNLQKNKLKDIREELYQFMQTGKMPITVDGCFLAYKYVRNDFRDAHSGTLDNTPGKVVSMPPTAVDSNRNNLCSTGLHFCSRSYLTNTPREARTVVVKVNPRFVFAIPTDYNNTKGRTSEYFVVGECTGDPSKDEAFLEPFIYDDNMTTAAPSVKFTKSLKASLADIAEGYGLAKNGSAWVRVKTVNGQLASEKYSIVKKIGKGYKFVSALTGKNVPRDHVQEMSITTKSVRSALVRAVAKNRHR